MSKKPSSNGFNLYKNDKFQFVVLVGDDESQAIKAIKSYVEINNFDLSEFTYRQFNNHSSDGFETKTIK